MESSNTFLGDSILTVDLATISTTGDVFVLGRVTDFAVLASRKVINLSDLDQKLLTLPFIRDGYIAPVRSPDSSTVFNVKVVVALRAGLSSTSHLRDEIVAALSNDLCGITLEEDAIHFVESVTRNAHGKIMRASSEVTLPAQFKC